MPRKIISGGQIRKKHRHQVKSKMKQQPQPVDLPEWSDTPSATYQYRNRPGKPASRNHVLAEYEEFIPDRAIKPPWEGVDAWPSTPSKPPEDLGDDDWPSTPSKPPRGFE